MKKKNPSRRLMKRPSDNLLEKQLTSRSTTSWDSVISSHRWDRYSASCCWHNEVPRVLTTNIIKVVMEYRVKETRWVSLVEVRPCPWRATSHQGARYPRERNFGTSRSSTTWMAVNRSATLEMNCDWRELLQRLVLQETLCGHNVELLQGISEADEGKTMGYEVAVSLENQQVPIRGGKIIMYVKNLPQPVMTDFLMIACCHRVGTYLTNITRVRHYCATENVFQVWWVKMKICAPELKKIFSWTSTHMRRCIKGQIIDCCWTSSTAERKKSRRMLISLQWMGCPLQGVGREEGVWHRIVHRFLPTNYDQRRVDDGDVCPLCKGLQVGGLQKVGLEQRWCQGTPWENRSTLEGLGIRRRP